jgi:hypothetical protein
METKTFQLKLIKSKSLDQFKTADGKARMLQPYWVEIDGAFVMNFINSKTDKLQLETQIYHGIIWIQDKYK